MELIFVQRCLNAALLRSVAFEAGRTTIPIARRTAVANNANNNESPSISFIRPSFAITAAIPPRGEGWLHEIKIDGFRVQLHKQAGRAVIYGSDGRDLTAHLPQLRQNLLMLPVRSAIIDGLVVARDGNVKLAFEAFLAKTHTRCCCWCFDLLEYEGLDMRTKSLVERKARLEPHVRDDHLFRYCSEIRDPDKALAVSERIGFRGVVSKRADQPYKSGRNSGWIEVASAPATARPLAQNFAPRPRTSSARRTPAPRRSTP